MWEIEFLIIFMARRVLFSFCVRYNCHLLISYERAGNGGGFAGGRACQPFGWIHTFASQPSGYTEIHTSASQPFGYSEIHASASQPFGYSVPRPFVHTIFSALPNICFLILPHSCLHICRVGKTVIAPAGDSREAVGVAEEKW